MKYRVQIRAWNACVVEAESSDEAYEKAERGEVLSFEEILNEIEEPERIEE